MGKALSLEDKTSYLKLAIATAGYGFDVKIIELIVKMYDGILLKGGKFDLNDCVLIQSEVNKRYPKVEVTAIPNEEINL